MSKLKRSASSKDLRSGFTTGACAAAAARAAVRALITSKTFLNIEIRLPNRDWVTFPVFRLDHQEGVLVGIIKDAGDDPDCTDGLEIQCTACFVEQPGIHIYGGIGVATVTKAGLELTVGEPAINPVPRANIIEMVSTELTMLNISQGISLTISVPNGEKAAKDTINERLGLIGGISILGTRGTVKPYSTSAFAASVRQSIQLAAANQCQHVVLTTGSRSEKAAIKLNPRLDLMAFIQAGDFMGIGLRASKRYQVNQVTAVAMIGKLGKLVSGKFMTHVSGHKINFSFLSELAKQEGIPLSVCSEINNANTGRQVLDILKRVYDAGIYSLPFLERLCKETQIKANLYTADKLDITIILIDFDGTFIASYPSNNNNIRQKG
jgi:cobalt-precorrin-5B (C1)-methyltransferase